MRSLSDDILSRAELSEIEKKIDHLELLVKTEKMVCLDHQNIINQLRKQVTIIVGFSSFTFFLLIATLVADKFLR